jgi:plasmid stability protein
MATIVVKNLPDSLHEKLRQQASCHHRSVTKEVINLIEAGVSAPSRPPFELPPPLKLRSGHMLTIDEIEAAIAEGQE